MGGPAEQRRTAVDARRSFVGRENELGELEPALDGALTGYGSLMLVCGEPGIGKTRLASEVAALAAERGARVAWGRCWEGQAPAYEPWLELLRSCVSEVGGVERLAPEIRAVLAHLLPSVVASADIEPRPGESELARFRLFDAMWRLVQASAAERPIVLLLDDLHWSDVSSMRFLEFVAQSVSDVPMLVVGAYREVDVRQRPDLSDALAAAARHGRTLPLRGLSEDEVVRFVTAGFDADVPPDIAPRLHGITRGNPFFVDELVRLLVAEARLDPEGRLPIPQGVREVIRRRLAPLPEAARQILLVASVVGRTFRLGVVADASGRSLTDARAALWDACSLELVEEADGGLDAFRFVHELVRETLYEDLPPTDRMRIHLRVAEVLEGAPDAHPGEIAHHFFAAAEMSDRRSTLEHIRRAGRHAMQLFSYDEAAMWFDRGLAVDELTEPRDAHRRFDLMCAIGEANRCAARFQQSLDAYAAAVAIAVDLDDPAVGLTRAALGFEDVRMSALNLWQLPASMVNLRTALDAVGDTDPPLRAQLLARLAQVLLFLAPEEAPVVAREALDIGEGEGDPALRAVALEGLRWAIWQPDRLPERLAVSSDWLATAQQASDDESALRARILLGIDFLEMGEIGAVTAQVAAFEREAHGLHQAWFNWWPAAFATTKAMMEGAFVEAEEHLERVREAAERFDSLALIAAGFADGLIAWERGDARAVEAAVERVVPFVPLPAFREASSLFERAADGDVDGTRAELEGFMAVLHQIPEAFMRPSMVASACPGVALVGDRSAAETLYGILAPHAGRPLLLGPLPCFLTTSHWLGVLAVVADWPEDAERHFEDALALAARARAPAWAARTKLEYGRLLLERNRERGVAMLEEARGAAERMGMPAAASDARVALGDDNSQPSASPDECMFRCEGDMWRLTFAGAPAQVRASKGLSYLRELLSHPGEEMHVLGLQSVVDGSGTGTATRRQAAEAGLVADSARGDDLLDAEAKSAYRDRMLHLREEIDEATLFDDPERAARSQEELEELNTELSRSLGLGGRDRQSGSAAERARVNVTRSIKGAIGKISDVHPALGEHLTALVRTGTFCIYTTDPAQPVHWST